MVDLPICLMAQPVRVVAKPVAVDAVVCWVVLDAWAADRLAAVRAVVESAAGSAVIAEFYRVVWVP